MLAIFGLIGVALGLGAAALTARSGDADKQAIATLEHRIVKAIEAKDAFRLRQRLKLIQRGRR